MEMAMIFDSDEECDIKNMLDDDDDDEDDADYVPDGGLSDSDLDYGRKKRKSHHTPSKRGRRRSLSNATNNDATTANSNETIDNVEKKNIIKEKGEKLAATKPHIAKKRKSSINNTESSDFLRRSSRSTRARGLSYADADVSEEELLEYEDLELNKDPMKKRIAINVESKKKHVDELWSKFKTDVSKNEKLSESRQDIDIKSSLQSESVSVDSSTLKKDSVLSSVSKEEKVDVAKKYDGVNESSAGFKSASETIKDPKEPELTDKEALEKEILTEKADTAGSKINLFKGSSEERKAPENFDKVYTQQGPINKSKEIITTEQLTKEVFMDEKEEAKQFVKLDDMPVITFPKAKDITDVKNMIKGVHSTFKEQFSTVNKKDEECRDGNNHKPKEDIISNKCNTNRSGIANFLSSGVKKSGGLSSVLNTIEKKKKLTVLDRTKSDWETFKSEADLEDELKGNRNAGYLDRQEFLQRVDYKQWENEREMRLYSNKK